MGKSVNGGWSPVNTGTGRLHLTRASQFAKLGVEARKEPALHIISRKKLLQADRENPGHGLAPLLDGWYRAAKSARWKNLEEIRRTYAHADGVAIGDNVYTVFNIKGNHFRLITEIFYEDQTILVRHVLTHGEYDRGNWRK
jgi:mRNA interferase HigB